MGEPGASPHAHAIPNAPLRKQRKRDATGQLKEEHKLEIEQKVQFTFDAVASFDRDEAQAAFQRRVENIVNREDLYKNNQVSPPLYPEDRYILKTLG